MVILNSSSSLFTIFIGNILDKLSIEIIYNIYNRILQFSDYIKDGIILNHWIHLTIYYRLANLEFHSFKFLLLLENLSNQENFTINIKELSTKNQNIQQILSIISNYTSHLKNELVEKVFFFDIILFFVLAFRSYFNLLIQKFQ